MEEEKNKSRLRFAVLASAALGLLALTAVGLGLLSAALPTQNDSALRNAHKQPIFSLQDVPAYDITDQELDKRAGADVSQDFEVTGFMGDGLFAELFIGSDKQRIIFSIDTSFSYLLANNFTLSNDATDRQKALSGFDAFNSSSFVDLGWTFNLSNIDGEYAYGLASSDYISLGAVDFPQKVTFGLTLNNSINIKNNNVVGGSSPKIVILPDNAVDNRSYPSNILGLSLAPSDNSFLTQVMGADISKTRLFSLYVTGQQKPVITFGSVDTSQYKGDLYMTPILPVQVIGATTSAYKYPFISLTGITLANADHGASLDLNDNPLSIPTLLDTSSVMSYLPYWLLVELASQFGAYYSAEQSLWIQSCSFMRINGTVGFQFHEVIIQVPLRTLFVPLINSNGQSLYLESGDLACALAFSPAEGRGFSSLGAPFFEAAYVVFDYSNNLVGLAQAGNNTVPASSSGGSLVAVNGQVGDVVSASTYTPTSTPTATLKVPQSTFVSAVAVPGTNNSGSTAGSRTINAENLLTSAPTVTNMSAGTISGGGALTITPTASMTQANSNNNSNNNGNAVSVTVGTSFEAGGVQTNGRPLSLVAWSVVCVAWVLVGLLW